MTLPSRDEARAVSLAHLQWMARRDTRYARWAAEQLAIADPEWHADALARLDAFLVAQRIEIPRPYVEPSSQLPKAVRGRPLPKRKFFHDTL